MKRFATSIAAVAGAFSIALGCAGIAHADTGLVVNTYGYIQDSGQLLVSGQEECPSGTSASISVVADQGLLTNGVGNSSVTCDGNMDYWAVYITPIAGSWQFGSATAIAILLDGSNVQLAEANQGLTVYHV